MNYQKIAANTIIQILGKIATTLIGLLTIGLLLRYLGQTGYGEYTTVLIFVGIFSTLTDLGLYIVHVREISKLKDHSRVTSSIITLRLVASLIILALAPILAWLFFPYPLEVKLGIFIATSSFLFISLNQILVGVFQKNLQMIKVVAAELAGRLVLLAGVYWAIKSNWGLLALVSLTSLSSFITFLISFKQAQKLVRLKLIIDTDYWFKILKVSLPIALSIAFNLIYFKVGAIILSIMKPAGDMGIFGAGFKVLEILITFPASFVGLLMPYLSRYAASNKPKFRKILSHGFNVLSLTAIPLIVGAHFTAVPLLTFLGKADFAASGLVLRLIIWAAAFIFLGQVFTSAVVALNQQGKMMWGYLTTALISLLLNLALIPTWSYYGAGIASVISEFIIMIWAMIIVYKKTGSFVRLNKLPKIILASMIMGLALWLFNGLNVLILISLSGLVYLASLVILKAVNKKTILAIIRSQ